MLIKVLEVSHDAGVITVKLDRGSGPEDFVVKNKMDLMDRLMAARAWDSDYAALKALVGTEFVL